MSYTKEQVLAKFSSGPQTGVFTDGGCAPNPGPGGWGVVWVQDGEIIKELFGHNPDTTNNRMELTALIEAFKMLDTNEQITVHTDSNLCVQTINQWAKSWEKNGWKRKTGPIANLELIKELYQLAKEHPHITLKWIKAHDGSKWNEYADALANTWTR